MMINNHIHADNIFDILNMQDLKQFNCRIIGCNNIIPFMKTIQEVKEYKCPNCFNHKENYDVVEVF